MSNIETQHAQKELDPQELANALERLVDHIYNQMLESSNQEIVEFTNKAKKKNGLNEILLPMGIIKECLPDFYEQVIKDTFDNINHRKKLYQHPEEPISVFIDKTSNKCAYAPESHSLYIGLLSIRKMQRIEELPAVLGHELGHSFQLHKKQNRKNTAPNDKHGIPSPSFLIASKLELPSIVKREYDADRHSPKAEDLVSFLLSSAIEKNKKYKYDDYYQTHPNHYNRIRVLLEQKLGNEIFGFNGSWQKRPKKTANGSGYFFCPNTIAESHGIIKDKMQQLIGKDKEKPDGGGYAGYRLTEDGKVVTNWSKLEPAIMQKAEELMLKLDALVESGLNIESKNEWLAIVEKEVAEFRKIYQPEFMDLSKLKSANWMGKMQVASMRFQRGV